MTTPETLHRMPGGRPHWPGWLVLSQLLVAVAWSAAGWAWGLPLLLASHAVFLVPVFLPNSRFYGPVCSRLPEAAGNVVWLTIDDGPGPDTLAVLDLLDRHDARATFFVVGEHAQAQPALVREILRRGHDLGNHSHTHPQTRFWRLGPKAMAAEIEQCQQVLQAICGQPPRWYRSVVGMTNPFVAPVLRRLALRRAGWSARGYDGVDCTAAQALARLLPDLRPGAIVLLHEGAAHGQNPAIIEGVLCALAERGLQARLPLSRDVALSPADARPPAANY